MLRFQLIRINPIGGEFAQQPLSSKSFRSQIDASLKNIIHDAQNSTKQQAQTLAQQTIDASQRKRWYLGDLARCVDFHVTFISVINLKARLHNSLGAQMDVRYQ